MNHIRRRLCNFGFGICLLSCLILACINGSELSGPKQSLLYGLGFKNDAKELLIGGKAIFGVKTFRIPHVRSNVRAAYGTVTVPIPKTLSIEWEFESGNHFSAQVDIRNKIEDPDHFRGMIWLHLQSDGTASVEVVDYRDTH